MLRDAFAKSFIPRVALPLFEVLTGYYILGAGIVRNEQKTRAIKTLD